MNYPLLAWSQRRRQQEPISLQDGLLIVGQLATLNLWLLIAFAFMKSDNFYSYVLPASIVTQLGYACLFGYQVLLAKLDEHEYEGSWQLSFIGPLMMAAMNFFKYGSDQKTFYAIWMMVSYHAVFEAQGMCNAVWRAKQTAQTNYLRQTAWWPPIVVSTLSSLAVILPANKSNVGFVFFYPLYGSTAMQTCFTTGSWIMIYSIEFLLAESSNSKYDERVFRAVTSSSMFIYLVHDVWIALFGLVLMEPLQRLHEVPFWVQIPLLFALTVTASFYSYKLLQFICSCGSAN